MNVFCSVAVCNFAFCLLSYIAFSTETLLFKIQLNHLKLVCITRMQHWTSVLPSHVPEGFLSSCSRCTLTCIASADPPLDGRCLLFRRAIALQKDSGSGVPIVSVTGSQLRCSNIPLLAGKKTWGSRNKFGVFFKAGSISMVVYSC